MRNVLVSFIVSFVVYVGLMFVFFPGSPFTKLALQGLLFSVVYHVVMHFMPRKNPR